MRYAIMIASLALIAPARADDRPPPAFEVTYDARVNPGPISARVYVMLGPAGGFREPKNGPDWFNPQPFFAVEAKDWKPGEPLVIGRNAVGFPGPLDALKPGKYRAQAVVRLNPDTHKLGDGEGNAFGPAVAFEVGPDSKEPVRLTVDQVVPAKKFPETETVKLVDIPSPMLSAFYKRPIHHRAAVILPEGLEPGRKVPTVYMIPGFGGDHFMAQRPRMFNYAKDMIRVVLDPDCGTGHHVFADSACNGPRGRALVEELIPYIEKTYPAIAEPSARLLNGHSSGGWSSLWLQVAYPDYFGGTWSTSPDPVTFADFQQINLYEPGEKMFQDHEGKQRPIARAGTRPILFVEGFSKMEDVVGDGGQLHSFEAVFSPLGPDGKPRPLYDRATGAVDTDVAKSWEKYDILRVLEKDWATLGPKLKGKLHVYTGEIDTFYLEGAVKLLKASQEKLGSDASIEVVPGKDHSSLLDREMSARIDREMKAATAKYGDVPR